MNKIKSYLFAFFLGVFTVIICLAIGDGLIGVAGVLGECIYDESGELIEYAVHVKDHTGKIVFWSGLLLLPVILVRWIRPRHTWINLPLYVLSWYVLSSIFGSHANHYFLAHPARGFISFFEEFDPFITAVFMWLTQLIVLLAARGIIGIIKKIRHRKESAE